MYKRQSYHYGAQHKEELKGLFKKSMVLVGGTGAAMFAASQLLAAPLVGVFVGYDAELAAMTLHGFRIYAVAFLVCGFNIYGSAFFTALNNGKVSALISFMRTLVFETFTVMLLPIVWGIDGVWSAIDVYKRQLRDLVAAVSNDFSRSERLFAEIFAVDLSDELANMRVPYLIVQGETDIVTSTRAIRAFVAECGNPNLRYAEAPRSGHMPGTAGMDLLFARMADFLGASTPAAEAAR